MSSKPADSDNTFKNVDGKLATRFLKLGLSDLDRPVDYLLERLTLPGGEEWFGRLLQEGPAEELGLARTLSSTTTESLKRLREVKEQAKSLFRKSVVEDARLAGLACYFLCVARGLVDHGEKISDQPTGDLDGVFKDLASVLPAPWRELVVEAKNRLG